MEEAERLPTGCDHGPGRVLADDTLSGLSCGNAAGADGKARLAEAGGEGGGPRDVFGRSPDGILGTDGTDRLTGLVRKDLQLFFSDRRSVILTFAVPLRLPRFFGSNLQRQRRTTRSRRDPDCHRPIATAARSERHRLGTAGRPSLATSTPPLDEARTAVQRGDVAVVAVVPPGFGERPAAAFLSQAEKPQIELLFDPSRGAELAMVRGMLTGHVMEAVGGEVFGGAQGRAIVDETLNQLDASAMPAQTRDTLRSLLQSVQRLNQQSLPTGGGRPAIAVPYRVKEDAVTGGANAQYNGYAHSFAGMGIQFLLFAAIELAMGILIERELGIWKRFRSAPLSRFTLLAARGASGTIITLLTLLVSFAFAMIVFGVKIHGSVIGFLTIAVACSIMAATFGLLVAALGKTGCGHAARGDLRGTDHGDARRCMGAVVHLPGLASADHGRDPRAVGRGRPRRDDLAGTRSRCGNRPNARAAGVCRPVCRLDAGQIPLGRNLNSLSESHSRKHVTAPQLHPEEEFRKSSELAVPKPALMAGR
jgi:ABC-2 type transport system permease protein